MKILLINSVMTARGRPYEPPYGLLYVGGALLRAGHEVEICDPDFSKASVAETLALVEAKNPDAIGIGGIITGYAYQKQLTLRIKRKFPHLPIVAGGYVASAPHLLLERAGVDVVVSGEGELTAVELFDRIERRKPYDDVRGIVFKRGAEIVSTPPQNQIYPLDNIPFPPYHLVNMDEYLFNPLDIYTFAQHPDREDFVREGKKLFNIKTARGCTNRCTFCYRLMRGIRQHSVPYVIKLMRHLYDTYNVGVFDIDDELTTSRKDWTMQFCQAIKDSGMKIFFRLDGVRVDTVDGEILQALKDAGCIGIDYGFESGSQRMLDSMKKRATVAENLRAAIQTRDAGMLMPPQIIVGLPGENDESIEETLDFLKKCDTWPVATFFATAYPRTELYDYALRKGLIQDEEAYIISLTNAWDFRLNLTDYPDAKVKGWKDYLQEQTEDHYLKTHREYGAYCFKKLGLRGSRLAAIVAEVYSKEGSRGVVTRAAKRLSRVFAPR